MSTIIATSGSTGIEVAEKILVESVTVQGGGGQSAYILITSTAGATLTCGSQTYTLGASETEHAFSVGLGTHTVTASKSGNTVSDTVVVTNYNAYHITLIYSRLPNEYKEVEWIETDGNQYIDTGYYVLANDVINCTYMYFDTAPDKHIFGSKTDNHTATIWLPTNGGYYRFGNGFYRVEGIAQGVWNNITATKGYLSINNITICQESWGFDVSERSLFIFKSNGASNGNEYASAGRCAAFYISDVRNFVPCYRKSDNVVGMYDLCGSTCSLTNTPFYINAGTGFFVAGPDVN